MGLRDKTLELIFKWLKEQGVPHIHTVDDQIVEEIEGYGTIRGKINSIYQIAVSDRGHVV